MCFRRYKEKEQKVAELKRHVRILKRAKRLESSFCHQRKYHSHHDLDHRPYTNGVPADYQVCHSSSARSLSSVAHCSTTDSLVSLEQTVKAKGGLCYWDRVLQRSDLYTGTLDYLHYIDSVSRKLFPATFLLCNLIYWTSYLYVL